MAKPLNVHTLNQRLTKLTAHLPRETISAKPTDTSWLHESVQAEFTSKATYCSIWPSGVDFHDRRMTAVR